MLRNDSFVYLQTLQHIKVNMQLSLYKGIYNNFVEHSKHKYGSIIGLPISIGENVYRSNTPLKNN